MSASASKQKRSRHRINLESGLRTANAALTGVGVPELEINVTVDPENSNNSNGLGHTKTVLLFVKAGLTGIGIPGVEAIPGVPLEIIAVIETMKTNQEDVKALLRRIDTIQDAVLAPIRAAREREGFRVPDELRVRLTTLINEFQKSKKTVLPFKGLSALQRLRKRTEIAAAVKEAVDIIGDAISVFQTSSQVAAEMHLLDVLNHAQRTSNHVEDLQAGLRDHDAAAREHHDDGILSKLKIERATSYISSKKSACLSKTRVDLLRRIYDDLSDGELSLVCLYGSPGTGKSAVAKTVAEALYGRGLLAASYFFDKRGGNAGNVSLATFVSTLAYRFSRMNATFRTALVARLRHDDSLFEGTAENNLKELILGPLSSLPIPPHPFVIVLDALDECGDSNHQRRLLRLLRDCVDAPESRSRITFLLTCRPEVAITDILQHDKLSKITAAHHLNQRGSEQQTIADIAEFVASRFGEIIADTDIDPAMPLREEIDAFAALDEGLFELAAVRLRQIDSYCRVRRGTLQQAIAAVGRTTQVSATSRNPLRDVYETILKTAYPEPSALDAHLLPSASALQEWYRDVMGALVCVHTPLSVAALSALVGIDEADIRMVLQPLSSVILVPNHASHDKVRFYHASFREFAESPTSHLDSKSSTFPERSTFLSFFLVAPVRSHTILAKRALMIMNELQDRNILHLPDPSILNAKIDNLQQKITDHISESLQYASLYWADHLLEGDASHCGDLLVLWSDEKMMFYLEMLSLLGELERAVPHLETAEDWAKKLNLAPTATLLNDCQRLVQMFYPAISQSAGAVYSSAIPFMPSSYLHNRYSRLGDGGPDLIRGRLSAWPAQILAAEHPSSVFSVAFSPDGRRIASGCVDGLIRLLSATTGRIEQLLKGHTSWVNSVAWSPDGARIVSGSANDSVRIWSAATGEQERVLEGHADAVRSVAFSSEGARIVSGSSDHTVRIWSAASGEQERVLEGHADSVYSVAFSADGTRIVSGSYDRTVRVWSAASGEQERLLEGHSQGVNSVAFSPNGARIVSGSNDCTVRIWSAASGGQERVLEGHISSVSSVAFSPDGTRIVSGSDDGTVRIWSAASGEQERVLEGPTKFVTSVAFSPDGRAIKSTDFSNNTLCWDAETGRRLDPDHPLTQLDFPPTAKSRYLKDGWLRVNGLSVWLPRYIQGWWWSARDMVVIRSRDTSERLAFIRLPSGPSSDRT